MRRDGREGEVRSTTTKTNHSVFGEVDFQGFHVVVEAVEERKENGREVLVG